MEKGLFRRQVVKRQGERLWGELILVQPLSVVLLTVFIAGITLLAAVFLWVNDYSRKQEVRGYLVPDKGLVQVRPPREGLLLAVRVEHGERVEQGELLYEVRVDRRIGETGPVTERVLGQLDRQKQQLRRRLELAERNLANRLARHEQRRVSLNREFREVRGLWRSESELLDLKHAALERARKLRETGVLATAGLEKAEEAYLRQRGNAGDLALELARIEAELERLGLDQAAARTSADQQKAELASEIAELEKQAARLRAEQVNKVFAPVAGTVAGINAEPGQLIARRANLVTLIPEGSRLQARLLVPGRGIAFLAPGQSVDIRYDAFPYQKFGLYQATIDSVSSSVVPPSARDGGQGGSEPLFHATARLQAQAVRAYGEAVPLKPGMSLSATIVLEERSLLEWLMDPLLSVGGRL